MKPNSVIIPGDLATTREAFVSRLDFARQNARSIHIDIADGQFVDSTTLPIKDWPALDIDYAEAHLMVKDPIPYLTELKQAGITRAIVHIESFFNPDDLIAQAKEIDILLGFAVNPDTDLEHLKSFFDLGNYIQVMGIEPGKTGQPMLPQTPLAVSYLRRIPSRRLVISVDGGVHPDTLPGLRQAGANFFVASSSIYDSGDWVKNYKHMLELVKDDE